MKDKLFKVDTAHLAGAGRRYPRASSPQPPPRAEFRSMVGVPVSATPTVLLYSPHAAMDVDYQPSLEAAGYRVVRSATVSGCSAYLDAGVDLVLLVDPPWELAKTLVAALDAAPLPIQRLWVSSWSQAPSMAGKLGVDALLLEPRDVDGVVAQVQRTLATARPPTEQLPIVPRAGNRRAPTVPELHPSSGRLDRFDEDTSDSWP